MDRPKYIVVVGPTASGKTGLGYEIAERYPCDIVCLDSVQLYKGFDIGSAKPTKDQQRVCPHHLFDVLNWNDDCDAAIYARMARNTISSTIQSGRIPLFVGGTGLYLRALQGDAWDEDLPKDNELRKSLNERSSDDLFSELTRLDPRRASELHRNDRFRVVRALEILKLTGKPIEKKQMSQIVKRDHLVVVLLPERQRLHEGIACRTQAIIKLGLVDEVKSLLAQGVEMSAKPMQSIGYKEAGAVLTGTMKEKDLEELINAATRQYAKRQCTWFKKIARDLNWTSQEDSAALFSSLEQIFAK